MAYSDVQTYKQAWWSWWWSNIVLIQSLSHDTRNNYWNLELHLYPCFFPFKCHAWCTFIFILYYINSQSKEFKLHTVFKNSLCTFSPIHAYITRIKYKYYSTLGFPSKLKVGLILYVIAISKQLFIHDLKYLMEKWERISTTSIQQIIEFLILNMEITWCNIHPLPTRN